MDLKSEARAFSAGKGHLQRAAAQRVALLCLAGIDIDRVELLGETERPALVLRLTRLIERERMRGANRHWSYDLNRHIALKQALDEIRGTIPVPRKTKPAPLRRRSMITSNLR